MEPTLNPGIQSSYVMVSWNDDIPLAIFYKQPACPGIQIVALPDVVISDSGHLVVGLKSCGKID